MKYFYEKQTQVELKPSDVYAKGVQLTLIPNILKTKKIIAFRPPVSGEEFITWDGGVDVVSGGMANFNDKDPRFIIKDKPPVVEIPFPEWE